jgi:hypothetical protein
MKENFEDTQGVIRSGISKKTRDELDAPHVIDLRV